MARGIYHDTSAQQDDFVVYKDHRRRYRVDLVGRGGTHVTIGPTRGYGSMNEATQAANEEAHRRGILDGLVFDGDRDMLQIGHVGEGYPRMKNNPTSFWGKFL